MQGVTRDTPYINLHNYECPTVQDSPYVLTSPRSLEACRKLGIKPVELLHRSVEEYEEELIGTPLKEIYDIYERNEKERKVKVENCQLLRTKLIKDHGKSTADIKQESKELSRKERLDAENHARVAQNSASQYDEPEGTVIQNKTEDFMQYAGTSEICNRKDDLSSFPVLSTTPLCSSMVCNNVTTTFDTSFPGPSGHRRVNSAPPGELATAEFAMGRLTPKTTRRQSMRRKSSARTARKSPTRNISGKATTLYGMQGGESQLGSCPQLDGSNSPLARANDRNNNSNKKSSYPTRRTRSVSEVYHLSPRRAQGTRTKPPSYTRLSDLDILRKSVEGSWQSLESLPIPEHDRRILSSLAFKKQEEEKSRILAQQTHLVWSLEKDQHIQSMFEESERWKQQVLHKQQIENEENQRRYDEAKMRLKQTQELLEKKMQEKEQKVQENLQNVHDRRKKEQEERRTQDEQRRVEVAQALKKILEEEQKYREILKEQQERRMAQAEQKQRELETACRKRLAENNRLEEERRQERLKQLEQQAEDSLQVIRAAILEKEEKAKENLSGMANSKDHHLKQLAIDRTQRQARVLQLKAELDKGLEQWRQQVLRVQELEAERAQKEVDHRLEHRRQKVREERQIKEHNHQILMQRIQAEEEAREKHWRLLLRLKAARMVWLEQERQRAIQDSRVLAHTTAELREHLKRTLTPETFDRKVARAQLEMRVTGRPPAPAPPMHCSHICLG